MKSLSATKIRRAGKINSYLEEMAPPVDLSDRSKVGPILKIQLALSLFDDDELEDDELEDDEFERIAIDVDDVNVQIVHFGEIDDESGHRVSQLIPKDLLGLSCVIYRPERIEVCRHWTKDSPCELTFIVDWNDPQLKNKVLVAATEDICADWESAF